MAELEDFLDNHSIHSNGIKRSFPTLARMRGAYRDCSVETEVQTGGLFNMDWLLRHYERAWAFYKARYARRKNPAAISTKILECHYDSIAGKPLGAKQQALADALHGENINVALLILLLLNAIPGYDSKGGDVTDIDARFESVLNFLQEFTRGCGIFDVLPVIKMAREETHRTRLMLIFHTINILDTYESLFNPESMGQANVALRESYLPLDITGYWEDAIEDAFWQIETASDPGLYFATKYLRESRHLLTMTRYTLCLLERNDGSMSAYLLHPEAMKRRIAGLPYGDRDNTWYLCEMPADKRPEALSLVRALRSENWPYKFSIRRISDPLEIDRCEYQLKSCAKIDPYEDCRYTLRPAVYAITYEALYVADVKEECLYKLPRYTEHKFELLSLDDNIGILEMGPEGEQRFLAIDERLLYIPLTERHLSRYGITRINEF